MPYIIPGGVGGGGDIPEYATGANYAVGSMFEWNKTIWRVETAIINAPAEPTFGSIHAVGRVFDQGDNGSGSLNLYQMQLGYAGTTDYPSYIATRHVGSNTTGEIRFNVNQGAQNEAFAPAKANLRIVGNGKAYLSNASGQYVAPDSDTSIVPRAYLTGYVPTTIPMQFVTMTSNTGANTWQEVCQHNMNLNVGDWWFSCRYTSGTSGHIQRAEVVYYMGSNAYGWECTHGYHFRRSGVFNQAGVRAAQSGVVGGNAYFCLRNGTGSSCEVDIAFCRAGIMTPNFAAIGTNHGANLPGAGPYATTSFWSDTMVSGRSPVGFGSDDWHEGFDANNQRIIQGYVLDPREVLPYTPQMSVDDPDVQPGYPKLVRAANLQNAERMLTVVRSVFVNRFHERILDGHDTTGPVVTHAEAEAIEWLKFIIAHPPSDVYIGLKEYAAKGFDLANLYWKSSDPQ